MELDGAHGVSGYIVELDGAHGVSGYIVELDGDMVYLAILWSWMEHMV